MAGFSRRNDQVFKKISNSLDGTEDDLIYKPDGDSDCELDDSFVRELFQPHSWSEFEGFDI